ncbi:post-COAP-1 domain-containing protein [Candidatus Nitrosotalea sp. FS]|uniref:post-COAP-1 domain-containing protein n=1 Tax=Candidatus Nitrosotalea sp. FS TaxID=2341021 RepID=UPI003744510A
MSSSGAIQQTQCPAGQSSNAGATSCFVVDTAPPTISITQPTDGSVLDHISSINGTASDDTSVSSIMVSVDGSSPQPAVYSSGTWTVSVTLSTGMHTANATATDSVGHKTSTGITHFTIFASTQGRVTGGGHIGQDQNFGFEVKSDDDHKKSITGHLEYHDKSKKIDLDGKKITSLSVYDSSKHAAFIGQGQIHDKDKTMYSFFVQVYDSDRSGDHDTFSIIITDSSGAVIYQNSGVVHGHIEIHKFADKDDKSDSGISH